jgi:macrolide transport system ATP-binding/permease protein
MSWRRFFHRNRADAELAEEMDHFIAAEIEENIARGMKASEARRKAYVKLGNPQQMREKLWRQNTIALADNVLRDLKYAARALSRSPGFTLIAVLVMALGIGANVALFTVVRSVLLNPLPYGDPGRLYSIYEREGKHADASAFMPVDAGSFFEWQKAAQQTAQMALVSPWQDYNVSAEGGKLPEKIDGAWCSSNFFATLGVMPALGAPLPLQMTVPMQKQP